MTQDDYSTDDTYLVVEPLTNLDSRIKYQCNGKRSGAAIARNNTLKRANGHWIAFLDSDDLWLPEKLERQLKFMVQNNYAFTYHEYIEVSEEGNDLGVYMSGEEQINELDIYICCWPGCLIVTCDMEKIGLTQIKDVYKNNDTIMWLKVVQKSPCYLLQENLARYGGRAVSTALKPLYKRIWAHYPLFHMTEKMHPIKATYWVLISMLGGTFKEVSCVKHYDVEG